MDPLTDFVPSITPYHYVYNNPIAFTDPSGMWPEDQDNSLASTFVDKDGNVLYHIDDGDPAVYLVDDIEAWVQGGRQKDGLTTIGWEDPSKTYNPGDQYYYYSPDYDPEYGGMASSNAEEYWDAHIRYFQDLGYYDEDGNPIYSNPYFDGAKGSPMSFMMAFGVAATRLAPSWTISSLEPTTIGEITAGFATALLATYIWYQQFAHVKKKQSSGKANLDDHDAQYIHGGKKRPKNKNQRKGAEKRRLKGKRIN